jgi:PRTRC genetic system protein C
MARQFIYDGRTFPDPDPNMSVDEVRQRFTDFFPELANADTKTQQVGSDTVTTFAKRVGTKG